MRNILDFISERNLQDLGEKLHWSRAEHKLGIEEVAKQINCPVLKLDRLEAGLERIEEKTLISLLNLYNEKLTIRLEAYATKEDINVTHININGVKMSLIFLSA